MGVGTTGPGVGLLSAVTSAVVVHKVSSEEGIYGMYVRTRTHLKQFHCFWLLIHFYLIFCLKYFLFFLVVMKYRNNIAVYW